MKKNTFLLTIGYETKEGGYKFTQIKLNWKQFAEAKKQFDSTMEVKSRVDAYGKTTATSHSYVAEKTAFNLTHFIDII